jgi:dCMP deaminase
MVLLLARTTAMWSFLVKAVRVTPKEVVYVTLSPCLACARIIFSMGISKVVYLFSYAEYKGIGSDEGIDFLAKFGVKVQRYSKKLEVSDLLI